MRAMLFIAPARRRRPSRWLFGQNHKGQGQGGAYLANLLALMELFAIGNNAGPATGPIRNRTMTISENDFHLDSRYTPSGDQPQAIDALVASLSAGHKHQILMGITGSGKTFTMANIIQKLQKPTLVIAHNKTLAAQLFTELKQLFPDNAVGFFISYYDYFQPEAYIPGSDTFIEKDSAINDDIDKMRHATTQDLFERGDCIIVASVSCIYGLGSPDSYAQLMVKLEVGMAISRGELLKKLVAIQYTRNDTVLERGKFRVRGDIVDILPASEKIQAVRLEFFGDEIEAIQIIDALTGKTISTVQSLAVYPNSHYVTKREDMQQVIQEVLHDLGVRLRELKAENKLVEAQRLEQRTMYDVEMMEQLGYCSGIENYSRYLTGGKPGDPPPTLLDYFPEGFLTIIDESHITVPQIGAMYRGDRSRKETLVNYGFRLPAALDNRPLNFDEFLGRTSAILHVSATPGRYETEHADGITAEQIIRPTGLLDPKITLKPATHQIDDVHQEILATNGRGYRTLITTLTKKMAEEITTYFTDLGVKVRYLHSDIDSLERTDIIKDFRQGVFDVLIGINLLREGLDMPEVGLVAILDADKEGFLRSRTSLIQTVGRAARNAEGRVIFYADTVTQSMQACLDETARRRALQIAYNEEHGITPATIQKELPKGLRELYGITSAEKGEAKEAVTEGLLAEFSIDSSQKLDKTITSLRSQMKAAAKELNFEKAAELRDTIEALVELSMTMTDSDLGQGAAQSEA